MPPAKAIQIGMAFLIYLLAACAKPNALPTATTPTPKPPKANINPGTVVSSVPQPKPKIVEQNIDGDPNQLLGLAHHHVSNRLGLPGFVRRDGYAEIWQYLAKTCILDIYLYSKNNTLKVNYVEVRGRGGVKFSRRDCFVQLLRAHFNATRG